jgi:hypothetical protein
VNRCKLRSDLTAAKSWVRTNQLGRRNLTPEQTRYLRGQEYEESKNGHGGDKKIKVSKWHIDRQRWRAGKEAQG